MAKVKRHYTRSEREILFNVYVMKVVYALSFGLNLFLPIFHGHLGFSSLFQYAILFSHTKGLLHGIGTLEGQKVPILQIALIRLAEVLWYNIISSKDILWPIFIITLIFDLLFIVLLIIDKGSYKYVRE